MTGECGEFIIKIVLANQQSELVDQVIIIIYLFSKLVYQDIFAVVVDGYARGPYTCNTDSV